MDKREDDLKYLNLAFFEMGFLLPRLNNEKLALRKSGYLSSQNEVQVDSY